MDLYKETIRKNFEPCKNFDPCKVYDHLGYTQEKSKPVSNKDISDSIAAKLATASANNNEDELWVLRQCGFVFRNDVTKQTFDAYLQGDDALEQLKIDASYQKKLQQCHDNIMEVKYEYSQLNRNSLHLTKS